MQPTPAYQDFASVYDAKRPQVVWTTLVADLDTPVSAFIKLSAGGPDACVFESVEGGAVIGRYSFLGIKPDLIWRCFGDRAEIDPDTQAAGPPARRVLAAGPRVPKSATRVVQTTLSLTHI